jgi:glycerol-3-phosphate dehydrogenase
VVDSAAAGLSTTGLHIPVPGEYGRFASLIPRHDGRLLIGMTDRVLPGPIPRVPEVPEVDVQFLLQAASTALRTPLTRADILSGFAGLRPLLDLGARTVTGRSSDLSRGAVVLPSSDGVVTVVGGKLTTYRRMAEEVVDVVARQRGLGAGASRTTRVALVGAGSPRELADVAAAQRLVTRYGVEAPRVAALGAVDRELTRRLSASVSATGCEALWAIRHEGALSVEDILDRRLRLDLVPAERKAAHEAVSELLAKESARTIV